MRTNFIIFFLSFIPEANWISTDAKGTRDNPVFLFFHLFFIELSISIFQSWRDPRQSLSVQTISLPPPSQSFVCVLCNAFQRIRFKTGSRFSSVHRYIFILHIYLFLPTLSPETIYLYAFYVDSEKIENRFPLM